MKPETQASYSERMLRVLVYIQERLDEAPRLEELAAVAHFSPFHFHRIFRGMIGESVHGHVRRLRLERAAHRLKFTDQPVTQVALEAGYETHEAFTRAFRAMFDDSPTGFRSARKAIPMKSVPSGVHYVADGGPTALESGPRGDQPVQVRIEKVDPMSVVFMRHIGPYDAVAEIWGKLFSWAGMRGLVGPGVTAVGVAYDDPGVTPPEHIRCDVCIVVDRPVEPEGEVALQKIGGGEYAVTRHLGPYPNLADTYAGMFGQWLPASGREPRSAPALEFYRNSPFDTPPEELTTDIYVPLEDRP